MLSRTFQTLETPIIGRVIELNKLLVEVTGRPIKRVQHNHCETLLKHGSLLFLYAMRQLKGKDYQKRAIEIIEEIQALNYLIYSLHGWDKKVVTAIDILCDDIAAQICKLSNVRTIQSKD